MSATGLDGSGPSSLALSDEERVFLVRSHDLLRGGPAAVRVGLGGLAPSGPRSCLSGLTLSPDNFQDFRPHGPRMKVDDLDAPSGEFVARDPLHITSRGANRGFSVNACTSDSLAAPVFTVPATPLPTFVDFSDVGLHAVPSEFPISLHNDSAPLPTSGATPASSTAVLDKAALGAIPPARPVYKHSVVVKLIHVLRRHLLCLI